MSQAQPSHFPFVTLTHNPHTQHTHTLHIERTLPIEIIMEGQSSIEEASTSDVHVKSEEDILLDEVKADIDQQLQAIAQRVWDDAFGIYVCLKSSDRHLLSSQWTVLVETYLQGFQCKQAGEILYYRWQGDASLCRSAFCSARAVPVTKAMAKQKIRNMYLESEAQKQKETEIAQKKEVEITTALSHIIGELNALNKRQTFACFSPLLVPEITVRAKKRYADLIEIVRVSEVGITNKHMSIMASNGSLQKTTLPGYAQVFLEAHIDLWYQVQWGGAHREDAVDFTPKRSKCVIQ